MGVKFQVARCGGCGKPRGLAHTCVTSMTRRPGRTRLAPKVTLTCATCGKPRSLAHTCTTRTDFRQRKAAAQRRQAAAKRRAAAQAKRHKAAARRRAAAERRKAAAALRRGTTVPAARPRSQQHDFRGCRDTHCERRYCLIWKEAYQEGHTSGYDQGYETGLDARQPATARE